MGEFIKILQSIRLSHSHIKADKKLQRSPSLQGGFYRTPQKCQAWLRNKGDGNSNVLREFNCLRQDGGHVAVTRCVINNSNFHYTDSLVFKSPFMGPRPRN